MSPRVGVIFHDIDDAHGGFCLLHAGHEFAHDVFLYFFERKVVGEIGEQGVP